MPDKRDDESRAEKVRAMEGLPALRPQVAGMDLGSGQHWVCAPGLEGKGREVVDFGATTPELRDGKFGEIAVDYNEDEHWLTMKRGPITMAINLGRQKCHVPIPDPGSHRLLMASDEKIILHAKSAELPSDSVAILGRG